jgi:hypothetical protein
MEIDHAMGFPMGLKPIGTGMIGSASFLGARCGNLDSRASAMPGAIARFEVLASPNFKA